MQITVVAVPQIAEVFKLVPLNGIQWVYTIGISIIPLAIMEIQKKFEEIKFGKTVYKQKNINNILIENRETNKI